jgi:hypothetical protein
MKDCQSTKSWEVHQLGVKDVGVLLYDCPIMSNLNKFSDFMCYLE